MDNNIKVRIYNHCLIFDDIAIQVVKDCIEFSDLIVYLDEAFPIKSLKALCLASIFSLGYKIISFWIFVSIYS